jgi:hypothetical protein
MARNTMTECIDDGQLRAYLDGELPPIERAAVGAHLAGCAACQARLATQRAVAAQARALLVAPSPTPDPHAALARLRLERQGSRTNSPRPISNGDGGPASDTQPVIRNSHSTGANKMQATHFWSSRRRALLASLAAVVAVLSLLALPPVRAAADELLSIFRVQRVVFLPVSQERLQQLRNLNFDENTLFVAKPTFEEPAPPRTVASAAEASAAIGTTLEQANNFPSAPLSTEFLVSNPGRGQFQVNAAAARQVLDLTGINDATIPDSLGAAPIVVDVPALAAVRYHGVNYDMTLHQGTSPSVTLPEGVDLAQLGKAALRLLGMTPEQAEATSQGINWSNTLLFPFPADTSDIRQVTINGENGLLTSSGRRGQQRWQLYWQRGDKLYLLEASGPMSNDGMVPELIATAESVR